MTHGLRSLLLVILALVASQAGAAEPVRASIDVDSAWIGQAVPLVITLYSPGPFEGTASFDFPDLPTTVFLRRGSPVVGSEEVDNESYLTQRHEFDIYTQQQGQVTIPPFPVRFSGKKSFIGEAEDVRGTTPELSFESKRPPGTEALGIVIAVDQLTVSQQWSVDDATTLSAGDVVTRTIRQQASGTTAMMLPVPPAPDIAGIRIYESRPVIKDSTQRGESTAERIDVIKYQFARGGSFEIPSVNLPWWNTSSNAVETATAEGRSFQVTAPPVADAAHEATEADERQAALPILVGVTLLGCAAALGWFLYQKDHTPEAIAARTLTNACRTNDAAAAYSAILNWERIAEHDQRTGDYESAFAELSQHLYSAATPSAPTNAWSGEQLLAAFRKARKEHLSATESRSRQSDLVELNPV